MLLFARPAAERRDSNRQSRTSELIIGRIWLRSTLDSTDSIKCLAHRADTQSARSLIVILARTIGLAPTLVSSTAFTIVTRVRAFQRQLQLHRIVATYNLDKENNT
jgi:hypothetical protein